MCFAVHCITATTDSPNSTIQSIKGGPTDLTPGSDQDSSSLHPSNKSSPGQSRSGAMGSSRSPYECPICFEQYQFEFEISPQSQIDVRESNLMEDNAAVAKSSETPPARPESIKNISPIPAQCESELSSPSPSFKDHLPRLMQCGHTLCSKCLGNHYNKYFSLLTSLQTVFFSKETSTLPGAKLENSQRQTVNLIAIGLRNHGFYMNNDSINKTAKLKDVEKF